MHCHLFIPDFFSTEGEDSGDRLVAAETLFAKGRRRRLAASSPEAWLFERFAVPKQRDWPAAPYTLLADGETPDMHTTPPSAAREGLIEGNLPSGPDAMRFHALMNEAQMLLHEHPVNAEREARGEPALNSVWFWGGGVIDAAKAQPFSAVITDDPLARGLALAAGIRALALPKDARSALAALGAEGRVLA